jgi:hypothetical protein
VKSRGGEREMESRQMLSYIEKRISESVAWYKVRSLSGKRGSAENVFDDIATQANVGVVKNNTSIRKNIKTNAFLLINKDGENVSWSLVSFEFKLGSSGNKVN